MKNVIHLIISFLPMFPQAQNTNQSLLWKVEGNGLDKPSYIYGTIHLACPEDIIFSSTLIDIFSKQHALYLELDMDDPAILSGAFSEMMMPGDTSLKTLLGDDAYEKAAVSFEQITRLPLALFNKAIPMMTMSAIYPALLTCNKGKSWELEFTQLAKEKHIPVYGLETLQEQIAVFEAIDYKEQAQMLEAVLKNTDSVKAEFTQMLEIYRQRDVEALSNLIRSSETMGSMEDILLNIRNKKWITRLDKIMQEQPTFIAVGAGHLGGNMGILQLLKQEGYTVQSVAY